MRDPQDITAILRQHGIQPSTQRVAVALVVLRRDRHLTADQVWQEVQAQLPVISRATIYNTLNLFVSKGLLSPLQFDDGPTVFDANVDAHHHFVDEQTGVIHDIPWDALEVRNVDGLAGFAVSSYTVVLRGRKRTGGKVRGR